MTQAIKPHPMQQFHDMLETIMEKDVLRPNRTGIDTVFVPGFTLKFDLRDGFPAITTKKLAFKAMRGELLGFFRGYTNAAQFEALGCKVWNANANENPQWSANPNRLGENDLCRIYGAQWTDWRDWRTAESSREKEELLAKGYEEIAYDAYRHRWVLRRGLNQLEMALRTIMTDPTNRRIMVTGWRPDEFDQMALPPCHVDYQFLVDTKSRLLHLCFMQRSFDTGLGFNVALGALFLAIMAKLSGYTASTMTHFIGDAHCYVSHLEGLREMIGREHFEQPTLVLGNSIPELGSVEEIPGVFTRIRPEDISLDGYRSHPAIALPMAV